ncbi:hypothetical protein HH682_13605 [Rosenbergiella sp. S61]|uniref:Uncharacterized protein n=1 Tax=Rosenbergiella gaditana TaxID=2726987 RepID=A0ABS5SZA1_9GAMM|nr:hypothetical protein [Rosenbergiella gaditana]MBT0725435.1 hypothetical protein [Rosenbergiella gaditana]
MTGKVEKFTGEMVYRKNSELYERLNDVISDYAGEISLAETVGVLEMVKLNLLNKES